MIDRIAMDVSRYVTESAAFTRATLLGKPSRWLVFILLGLPWTALSVLIEGSRVLEGTAIRWDLVPWPGTGLLVAAGILCNFLMSGWVVRLLRDDPVPPEFDRPLALCLDGIKVHTIPLVWMLVPSILAFVQFSLAGGSAVSFDLWHPDPATMAILLLLLAQIVIVLIAVQYMMIGAIRFARTGSVADAFALVEIWKTTVRIGIVNYYIGIGVVIAVWLAFSLCLRGIALIPFAGPVVSLCLAPVPTVYCFRFIAHFCDEDRFSAGENESNPAGSRSAEPITVRGWILEFVPWLLILVVLTVLCLTPAALIVARVSRLLP